MKYATRILIPLLATVTVHPVAGVLETEVPDPIEPSRSETSVQAGTTGRTAVPVVEPADPDPTAGGSDEQRALVLWALGQYESAGLGLPDLEFRLHPDESFCDGNSGYFTHGPDAWVITVCSAGRMVFLHEIGHAWAEYTLTDSDRVAYVELRGLDSWNDSDTPWRARGSEDAANTLAWGLVGGSLGSIMEGGPLADVNGAFRLLTGFDSPRIGTEAIPIDVLPVVLDAAT